jgi:hypothetical protein
MLYLGYWSKGRRQTKYGGFIHKRAEHIAVNIRVSDRQPPPEDRRFSIGSNADVRNVRSAIIEHAELALGSGIIPFAAWRLRCDAHRTGDEL